ncbi:S-adenosyl-L-methionine:carboxyl methyltransferase family protein [Arabidopsis lyrata subsp. lyrata]|uniref:S-adenosyl-L-methionine:carboxyl methyltransferase family protein n=1 Tax=Arabidopsis lyrata subsp. lyrata TaxID=81972 RepID=D7KCN1_ARALL|nr:S-adenosyl-L-methionine:carboxyl methyltransferase family protein [Arabidopsis lyrata subsp. lyrata]
MNGGDGASSYARNSSYQRGAIEAAEALLRNEINTRLDITNHSFSSFTIADFGCSSGPNTILAVDIIIQALYHKFTSSLPNTTTPQFQVFFNDVPHTDFNALFALLPPQRPYFVAGVPGSFYGNLFPKAHLNMAYSSCALCWLSDLPPELTDISSPAYNRGRIHYTGASAEVAQAYSYQYKKDIKLFLHATSQELAENGLMALIVPGVPDGFLDFQEASTGSEFDLLASCLMDMAREVRGGNNKGGGGGQFQPSHILPNSKELEDIIRSNGELKIDKMETLGSMDAQDTMPDLQSRVLYLRAVLEGLVRTHFGHKILDDLFDRYALKLAHSSVILQPRTHKSIMIFALLSRCHDI